MTLLLIAFGGLVLEQLLIHTSLRSPALNFSAMAPFSCLICPAFFSCLFFLYAATATRGPPFAQGLGRVPCSRPLPWIVLSAGYSWYISNFDRYARLYGSIAGLILLLVWIYLCCTMLLYGGVLNAVDRKKTPAPRWAATGIST
jgi:membrane protein